MKQYIPNFEGVKENWIERAGLGQILAVNKMPPGFREYDGRKFRHIYGDYEDKVYNILNPDEGIGEWLKYDILYLKALDKSWKGHMDEGDRIDYSDDHSFSGENSEFQENTFKRAISRYGNDDTLEGLDFFLKATQGFLESLTSEQKEKYASDIFELQRLIETRLPKVIILN